LGVAGIGEEKECTASSASGETEAFVCGVFFFLEEAAFFVVFPDAGVSTSISPLDARCFFFRLFLGVSVFSKAGVSAISTEAGTGVSIFSVVAVSAISTSLDARGFFLGEDRVELLFFDEEDGIASFFFFVLDAGVFTCGDIDR
jgi:hypothetical protein